jgi:Zn-dependent protease with chaperone function
VKYTPRETEGNVNVPKAHPLKELAILLCGLLGILLAVYIAAGFAVGFVVERMPPRAEAALGNVFALKYTNEDRTPAEQYLQGIVNGLDGSDRHTVHIMNLPDSNALALPGGAIVVFSGLVGQAESENELAFVLAHEIGHFRNRDHLKGLGRSLVLVAMSSALLGTDSGVAEFLMNSLTKAEMRFSQAQETAADFTGLELLNNRYGHVSGATDFFEKMSQKDSRGRFRYFFASHPYPPDRRQRLRDIMEEKGYFSGETAPLPDFIKNSLGSSTEESGKE